MLKNLILWPLSILYGIGISIRNRLFNLDILKIRGKYQLNLWEANCRQLRQVGVEDARIEVAGICTVCHHDQFFSYRGDRGNTGRFGAGIMLNI